MKKFSTGQVYWEIPSTIDLEAFLKKYPPTFVARPKIDYFYSLIEHLSSGMDEQDLDTNKGFINMNAKRCRISTIITNYTLIIFLIISSSVQI